ncbi:MAG: lipopolysaccharide transport periplasmic protein LptA [Vibrio sp.]
MNKLHLSLILCLLAPTSAWALKSDTKQPVYIDSDTQQLDMQKNQVIFEGNVKLTQGTIKINANKVVVYRDGKTGEMTRVIGYGSPTDFQQKGDDGKMLKGKGNTLDYKVKEDTITITTNAELQQGKSIIKGSSIVYTIGTQNLKANSSEGKRVSTVLIPNELQGN